MEKKLTKTQIKEMEKLQQEKRDMREKVVQSVKDYERDVQATKRYYVINEEHDKLTYGGDLKTEERERLLRRYDCLDFLRIGDNYTQEEKDNGEDRNWSFVREMYNSFDELHNYGNDRRLDFYMDKDDLWLNNIIWSTAQIKQYIRLALKYGYKRILYTNSSSGALGNITDFIDCGAKVVGTLGRKGYNKEGIILDITEIKEEM